MTQTDFLPLEQSDRLRYAERQPAVSLWIEDDGLLRDEGTVFGLSGATRLPESKIESIVAYFRARIERAEATRRSLLDERTALEVRAAEQQDRLTSLDLQLANAATGRPASSVMNASAADPMMAGFGAESIQSPNFDRFASELIPAAGSNKEVPSYAGGILRYLVGCVFALAICVFTYFIVREVVGNRFDHPEYVALAIMVAGMFIVFAPTSLLFSNDELHREPPWATELWKVRLAEFGPPIVAACFAVAWGESQDPFRFVTALLFLSVTFLLGGRLLLSLVTRLGTEFEQHRRWRMRRRREKVLRHELAHLQAEANAVSQHVVAINDQLRRLRTAEDLQAECDHKITLLQSEFELARAAMESRTGSRHYFSRADR